MRHYNSSFPETYIVCYLYVNNAVGLQLQKQKCEMSVLMKDKP